MNYIQTGTLLGKGAYASIYEAKDINGNLVALKILDKYHWVSSIEAEMLLHVTHENPYHIGYPYVMKLIDSFEIKEKGVAIVLDKMDGSLLDLLFHQFPDGMEEHMLRELTRQVVLGLSYIHDCGIIHLDLKIENILYKKINQDYLYCISDFGNAITIQEGSEPVHYKKLYQTKHYRATECILKSSTITTACDVFSLGCIIYEMATGSQLFDFSENEIKTDEMNTKIDLEHANQVETIISDPSIYIPFRSSFKEFICELIHPDREKRCHAHDIVHLKWMNYLST